MSHFLRLKIPKMVFSGPDPWVHVHHLLMEVSSRSIHEAGHMPTPWQVDKSSLAPAGITLNVSSSPLESCIQTWLLKALTSPSCSFDPAPSPHSQEGMEAYLFSRESLLLRRNFYGFGYPVKTSADRSYRAAAPCNSLLFIVNLLPVLFGN